MKRSPLKVLHGQVSLDDEFLEELVNELDFHQIGLDLLNVDEV